MKSSKLTCSFFARPTLKVAEELIGKILTVRHGRRLLSGRLVEVEAYIGETDRACHASRGRTPRNAIMYGEPGGVYVYFTYGNHFMLNFVTEDVDFPAAVLIRGMEPLEGIERMMKNRGVAKAVDVASGPGKLTKAMGITKAHYGESIEGKVIRVLDDGQRPDRLTVSPRIGIGKENPTRLWRFFDAGNPHVSKGSRSVRETSLPLTEASQKYPELIVI